MSNNDKHRELSVEYAQKHNLQALFSHLLQLVVHSRPENPREFMALEVARLQSGAEPTRLLTDDELAMMFELIDVTKRKTISLQQCRNAYNNLSTDGAQLQDNQLPPEVLATNTVNQEQFAVIIGSQLRTRNVWASA